jgi:hypothetical protein
MDWACNWLVITDTEATIASKMEPILRMGFLLSGRNLSIHLKLERGSIVPVGFGTVNDFAEGRWREPANLAG